jgi:phosphatidylserine decarboxylase
VITEFLGYFPKFADLGWGGYSYFEKNRLWFYGVAPNSSWTEVNKTVEPLFEAIRDKMSSFDVLSGGTNVGEVEMYTAPYDGVYNWFQTCTLFRGEDVGYNLELTSRLIPSETFVTEEKRAKFVERLLRADVRIDTL